MTDTTLEARRSALEARLDKLRVAPEAADLVRKADSAMAVYRDQIAALEGEMEKIDEVMGVRERDRRAAAAQQREEEWRTRRQALLAEQEVWLQAVADAEASTRGLVDALNRLLASNGRMSKMAHDLSATHKVPRALNPMDLARRMSGRIAGVLGTIKGHMARFGGIEWSGGGLYPPDRSWRDEEERLLGAGLIQPLLERGKAE